tara:strand:+ start:1770 stop:2471 length:702 start_codon:yes stop_codon:yes gene_type:complete
MPAFRFKQFSVAHDKCAMKVGTDGVLVGAWANHSNPLSILDIGTGSGLISFMMAQRFPKAIITGIDLDDNAIIQANENLETNRWKDRINFQKLDLDKLNSTSYDLIVSNPPFYNGTNKSGDNQRDLARQNNSLPPALLFKKVTELLSDNGSFCCILPVEIAAIYEEKANRYDLFIQKELFVKGNPSKEPKRILIQFGREVLKKQSDTLIIETDKRHEYTAQYLSLINEFYLFA